LKNRILLHICCAPCATAVVGDLRSSGYEVTGCFYNPSIHPWKEFERRLKALKEWTLSIDLPLVLNEKYLLENNLKMLLSSSNRCLSCFTDRLGYTAELCAELGISHFTSTLSVSPYQDHELLKQAGEKAAASSGASFIYKDFRESYKKSIELSRAAGIYRQSYCGCVFSERDRYLKTKIQGGKVIYPGS
jgi:predicted adenine nucleotide alpha hydrolase (AANH) superfamily ATPase